MNLVEQRLKDTFPGYTPMKMVTTVNKLVDSSGRWPFKVKASDNSYLINYGSGKIPWETILKRYPIAKWFRGLLVDYNLNIIGLPIPKFFEETELNMESMLTIIANNDSAIYMADKLDGSLVMMRQVSGKLIPYTQNGFKSDLLNKITELITDDYIHAYTAAKQIGWHLCFEYVGEKIIVSYVTRALVLTHITDSFGSKVPLPTMAKFAELYNLLAVDYTQIINNYSHLCDTNYPTQYNTNHPTQYDTNHPTQYGPDDSREAAQSVKNNYIAKQHIIGQLNTIIDNVHKNTTNMEGVVLISGDIMIKIKTQLYVTAHLIKDGYINNYSIIFGKQGLLIGLSEHEAAVNFREKASQILVNRGSIANLYIGGLIDYRPDAQYMLNRIRDLVSDPLINSKRKRQVKTRIFRDLETLFGPPPNLLQDITKCFT